MRTQSDNESTHIIAVLREEKLALMQKIQQYERQVSEKDDCEGRLREMEALLGQLQSEQMAAREEKRQMEEVIGEQRERLELIDTL